jgi:hypothetical protein
MAKDEVERREDDEGTSDDRLVRWSHEQSLVYKCECEW